MAKTDEQSDTLPRRAATTCSMPDRVAAVKQEWAESVDADGPDSLDDWPVYLILATEDRLVELQTGLNASNQWTRKLTMLVGECIREQRRGYDVLASAAWDEVLEHWARVENGRG